MEKSASSHGSRFSDKPFMVWRENVLRICKSTFLGERNPDDTISFLSPPPIPPHPVSPTAMLGLRLRNPRILSGFETSVSRPFPGNQGI